MSVVSLEAPETCRDASVRSENAGPVKLTYSLRNEPRARMSLLRRERLSNGRSSPSSVFRDLERLRPALGAAPTFRVTTEASGKPRRYSRKRGGSPQFLPAVVTF